MTQDKERSSEKKLFQWHPANYAGLQIEFEDEKKYLSFDDFYKVYGYTCFYKADTPTVNQIEVNELTITFISRKYPRKLLRHLELERGFAIQKIESGIYYIVGDAIPIQFIVANKLSQTENLWLKGLTNQLHNYELTAALTKDYYEHKQNTLYESVMDIIMRANKKQFEETNNMCEAMKEFIWEHYGDEIMKEKQASFTNGTQNGERKVNTLIFKLSELGRIDDILKSATDTEYQQQLFKEFGL